MMNALNALERMNKLPRGVYSSTRVVIMRNSKFPDFVEYNANLDFHNLPTSVTELEEAIETAEKKFAENMKPFWCLIKPKGWGSRTDAKLATVYYKYDGEWLFKIKRDKKWSKL